MDDISSEAGEMNRYLMCKLKNMLHDLIAARERRKWAAREKETGINTSENQKENTF